MKLCHTHLLSYSEDPWAHDVKSKLSTCFDMVAVGAKYHHMYLRVSFSKGQQLPSNIQVGRPKEKDTLSAFEQACVWLEKEIEIHTVSEFTAKIKELSEIDKSYSKV